MKKTLPVTAVALVCAACFAPGVQAQSNDCSDIVWSAQTLAEAPNIGDHCLEVVDKGGRRAVRLRARVVRQSVNSTVVQWQLPDGTWSRSERRYPGRDFVASIGDEDVRIVDLQPRQEVNVYVPMAEHNWMYASAAPAAAAAPPPPPPPPPAAPEPEPAPVAMPRTATWNPMLALLGGLFILLGGAATWLRSRQ